MDLPYHNSYQYNHEWPIPSTSDNYPLYPLQNHSTTCYNTSSCPPPSSYYDYYTPSTTNPCSAHYNTYSSFNQPHPGPPSE